MPRLASVAGMGKEKELNQPSTMLFSKQTPAAGGTAFAQFDAAWCYDGNGYILNETGTSLDVRIGATGSVITLAAGGTLQIKLVYSMAELYVRRTDQSTTQVTVEAQVGTGSAGGGGSTADMAVIAAASTAAHNDDAAAHKLAFTQRPTPNAHAPLGAELMPALVNLNGWTVGAGWSFSSGALHSAGNIAALSYPVAVNSGKTYFVLVKVSGGSIGTCTLTLGALAGSYNLVKGGGLYGNGEHTYCSFTATATTSASLTFTPSTDWNGTITSVSFREILGYAPVFLGGVANDGSVSAELLASDLAEDCLQEDNPSLDGRTVKGSQNTAHGSNALRRNVSGYQNSAFGAEALTSLTTGKRNNAFGAACLHALTTGYNNTGFGDSCLQYLTIGYNNTASGKNALYSATTGYENSAFGVASLSALTTGYHNTSLGVYSLQSITTGVDATCVGYRAGQVATGSRLTAFGATAGSYVTTGDANTCIGVGTGAKDTNRLTTASYNTFLGYNASKSSTTQHDYLTVIGANAVGDRANSVVIGRTADNCGIGVPAPLARLHLPAGTATAGTASMRIDAGVLTTVAVAGQIESDGTHLYWTDSGGTRKQLD